MSNLKEHVVFFRHGALWKLRPRSMYQFTSNPYKSSRVTELALTVATFCPTPKQRFKPLKLFHCTHFTNPY